MFERIVGALTVIALAIVTLGMGYPLENQNQEQNVIVDEAATATVELVESIEATQQLAESAQEQGEKSIMQLADAETIIYDPNVPLVANIVESSKRKTLISDEEKKLFQQVVSAESRGESFEAQYSVACVILNRVESNRFPNSVREVILQKGQFSCVPNGSIYRVPLTDSVVSAVEQALDNNTLDPDVLWFRSGYYHRFSKKAFNIGKLYYSSI